MTGTDAGVGVWAARERRRLSPLPPQLTDFLLACQRSRSRNALARFSRFVTGQIHEKHTRHTRVVKATHRRQTSALLSWNRHEICFAPLRAHERVGTCALAYSFRSTRRAYARESPSPRARVARRARASTMGVDDGSNPLAPEFANPLPPPSKPKGAGGSAPAATPMTNSDFRKLLSTPRAAGGAQVAPKGGRRGGGGDFQKPKPRKPAPRPKPVEVPPEEPAYRDRAKERREESAPEYQGELSGAVLAGVPGGVPGVTARDELRQLSVEESKFLGGDVEHTHLVKGLDFALLRKVRAEMAETEKDVAFERRREARASADVRGETRVPGRVPDPLDASSSPRGAFGRAVADAALAASALDNVSLAEIRPNERFASGRVSFAFDLSRASASDVPATTMRSASDPESRRADAGSNRVLAGKDAPVLERLGSALTRVRAAREATGGDDKRRDVARSAWRRRRRRRRARLSWRRRIDPAWSMPRTTRISLVTRDAITSRPSPREVLRRTRRRRRISATGRRKEASISPRATRAKEEDVRGDGGADARGLDGPMRNRPPRISTPSSRSRRTIERTSWRDRRRSVGFRRGGRLSSRTSGVCARSHRALGESAARGGGAGGGGGEGEGEGEAPPRRSVPERVGRWTPPPRERVGTTRRRITRRGRWIRRVLCGGRVRGAAFYASDEEEEEGRRRRAPTRTRDGNKGKKSGLGAGGKDKDGKMSARALEAQRDQKINSELGSLHKVMREKYGDKVDVAFGEPREGRGREAWRRNRRGGRWSRGG